MTRPPAVRRQDGKFVRRARTVALISSFFALLPGAVQSEGAAKLLDCTIVEVCDAAGRCEPSSGRVAFRMNPTEVEAGGAGRYALSYEKTEAEMDAMSDVGPFFWTIGRQRHVLVVNSETQWLWHQLELDPEPEAHIRFLACTFQQ